MNLLTAFLLGMREFRASFTSAVAEADAYESGRDFAHRLTLRHFEEQ